MTQVAGTGLSAVVVVDEACLDRADRVREAMLLPDDYRRHNTKMAAAGAVGGVVGAAIATSVKPVYVHAIRDQLVVGQGQWQLDVVGEGLLFRRQYEQVLVKWSDIAVWAMSKKDFVLSTRRNGRVVIPLGSLPKPMVDVISGALVVAKAPRRRISRTGNVAKFSDAGPTEKVVQVVLVTLGLLALAFMALVLFSVAFHA